MISIQINGQALQTESDPDTPLLYVLRNEWGLSAAKFGCGLGQCGACMVLLEDAVTYSCLIPIGRIGAAKITTLEGLSKDGALHPVQSAFLDAQAGQCGYCTNGMIMSATALLRANTSPDDAEIKQAMQGNLCRCGTQPRVIRAIKAASKKIKQ